jgi:hypothetical protein
MVRCDDKKEKHAEMTFDLSLAKAGEPTTKANR